jgi:hypothetical protein
MAGGMSSPKGAVVIGGVGVPPTVGHGLEARGGGEWCSWHACEGGRELENKGAGGVSDAFYWRGGRQGKERGLRGGVRVEERDERREGVP